MKTYTFAYCGEPKFKSPEEGSKYLAKWKSWVGELGDALVSPGTPFGQTKTVRSSGVSDGGGSNRLTGYSIVTAGNMEAALGMAKKCPHLEHGTIDIAEAMEMRM